MNVMGLPDGAQMVTVSAAVACRSTEGISAADHRGGLVMAGKPIPKRRSAWISNRENHAGA